jgi:hypothetical protein
MQSPQAGPRISGRLRTRCTWRRAHGVSLSPGKEKGMQISLVWRLPPRTLIATDNKSALILR